MVTSSIPHLQTRKHSVLRRLPVARPLILLISDSAALAVSLGATLFIQAHITSGASFAPHEHLLPLALVFLAAYWLSGLYGQPALSQPEEIERGAACSCCIFITLLAFTLNLRADSKSLTLTLAVGVLANLFLMPLLREVVRHLFSHLPGWGWGCQAVIFGTGSDAVALIERSRKDRAAGIHPVAVFDPATRGERFLCGLPIVRSFEDAALELDGSTPSVGILTVAAASSAEIVRLLGSPESIIFSQVVLLSNPSAISSMWAAPLSRRTAFRLGAKPRTHLLTYRVAKRLIDLSVASLMFLACLPIMAVIAVCIKCDSPGPFLFGHTRLGKDKSRFKAWKFRSMRMDGAAVLAAWFENHPSAKEEWLRSGKLQKDPRVTRAGHFLRVTSLDELPQLWNVLSGDMSLVGPRPIVDAEVCRYGEDYDLFSQAHGGVTGLWQVSGRSSTTYDERVLLDSFYVRHWSIWLDLTILLRTLGAVLLRKGAV